MTYLTVIVLYFSLGTVIYPFYGKSPIRMRMSPYSTYDVRLDLFTGFVSDMESRLQYHRITVNSPQNQLAHRTNSPTVPTRPSQLAPLILPTLPTSTTNSPHVVCQLARFSDQLAPTFTNSPHFSYQLAPFLLPTRPMFLPTPPTSRTK